MTSAATGTPEVIALASDHAGAQLKAVLVAELERLGFRTLDLGTDPGTPVDYPDMAVRMAGVLADGTCRRQTCHAARNAVAFWHIRH